MKCLIVLPKYSNPWEGISAGLASVSAALKRVPGLQVITLNANDLPAESFEKAFAAIIQDEKPEAVISGGVSLEYHEVARIFTIAKECDKSIVTIAGGHLITGDPTPAMEALEICDFGVIGEGEITATELCAALQAGAKDLSKINGLVIKRDGGYQLTAPRKRRLTWGDRPWPDLEGFGYLSPRWQWLNISVALGCPNQCTFCFNAMGRQYVERPLDDFFAELRLRVEQKGLNQAIKISSEILAVTSDRLKQLCAGLKSFGLGTWLCNTHVNWITEETVGTLLDAGCGAVCLGLESMNDVVLKSMRKNTTREKTLKALNLLERMGLPFHGNFIYGDPAETRERAMETFTWWQEHQQYWLDTGFIRVYPGSELYRNARATNLIKDPVLFLKERCPPINVSGMGSEEFNDFKKMVVVARTLSRIADSKPLFRNLKASYDLDGGTKTIRGRCPICNRELNMKTDLLFTWHTRCAGCRHILEFPLPKEWDGGKEAASKNLSQLLTEYGKVAFWGIGCFFRQSIDKDLISDSGIYLVDTNSGGTFADKPIFSPDVIGTENIGCVINSAIPDTPAFGKIMSVAETTQSVKIVMRLGAIKYRPPVHCHQLAEMNGI